MTVYSNQPSVELFVNGESLGVQESPEHFFYFQVPITEAANLVAVAGDCKDESFIRKVDKFNDAYRLVEKGAILNWFDITAPEGYLSLNDRLDTIMKTSKGKALITEFLSPMMAAMSGGEGAMGSSEMIEKMMGMMGGFTVLRMTSLMGAANVAFTKEQLLALNGKLNEIAK